MEFRNNLSSLLYFGSLIFIISLSFLFYAPCNYCDFNSDNAIHVLMSRSFEVPRDYFYWGQNRLGSLLPLLAFLLGKVLPVHNLYLCSIIQYFFLGTGFLIMLRFIQHRSLKIALCTLIFLPMNDYNALILIGHPYSSQLFTGSLFILCLHFLRKQLLQNELLTPKDFLKISCLSFLTVLFFFVGMWASEFNGILILIPCMYVAVEKKLRTSIFQKVKNKWFLISGFISIVFFISGFYTYKYIKNVCPIQDPSYDKVFIDTIEGVKSNIGYFIWQLKRSLFFEGKTTIENLFNWFLVMLCLFLSFSFKKKSNNPKSLFINTLLTVSLISCIILFLSTWNLRSNFCPRYFTPVYVIFCFALLLMMDNREYKRTVRQIISMLFVIFCVTFCYIKTIHISDDKRTPFEKYSEYSKLPKGTLIGGYWEVYKINSVAIGNLQSLPFDSEFVRNMNWRDSALKESNFYFINERHCGFKDIIFQFGIFFKYSGIRYYCNGSEVLLYHKLIPNQTLRFAIKDHNNMYLTVKPDKLVYVTQPEPAKAEIFELVLLGEGYKAIKAPDGNFICANMSMDAKIVANSGYVGGWETFEITSLGQTNVSIKSHANAKYIWSDESHGSLLFANQDKIEDKEIFMLEPR